MECIMTMTCRDNVTYGLPLCHERRIVVGVDSSEASLEALRWGVREARQSGAVIEAIRVYQPEPHESFAYATSTAAAATEPTDRARREAANELRLAVATALAPHNDVAVELLTVPGMAPAKELMRCARGASMLVVGESRRRPLGRLRPSVSARVGRHAPCPVVVVPPNGTAPREDTMPIEELIPAPPATLTAAAR